jgi:fatty-acyl-CoA synthase
MMKEYWQDPVKTEETIKNGYLHTGDMAWMDEDGFFFLAGRAGDVYISGGENVYPAEIEKHLKTHPDIQDVAVRGEPHDTWGECGHAFIIARQGACLTETDVREHCDGALARFKWPARISFCQSFPRTSLGKVRKAELE